jgi:hypothetical protein
MKNLKSNLCISYMAMHFWPKFDSVASVCLIGMSSKLTDSCRKCIHIRHNCYWMMSAGVL